MLCDLKAILRSTHAPAPKPKSILLCSSKFQNVRLHLGCRNTGETEPAFRTWAGRNLKGQHIGFASRSEKRKNLQSLSLKLQIGKSSPPAQLRHHRGNSWVKKCQNTIQNFCCTAYFMSPALSPVNFPLRLPPSLNPSIDWAAFISPSRAAKHVSTMMQSLLDVLDWPPRARSHSASSCLNPKERSPNSSTRHQAPESLAVPAKTLLNSTGSAKNVNYNEVLIDIDREI